MGNKEVIISGSVIDKTLKYLVFLPDENQGVEKKIYIRLTDKTRRMNIGERVDGFELVHDDRHTMINGSFTGALYYPVRKMTEPVLVDLEEVRQKTILEVREKFQKYVDAGVLVPERLVDRMRVLEDEEGINLVKKWRIRYWHLKYRDPSKPLRPIRRKRRELECIADYKHFYVSKDEGSKLRRGGVYENDGEEYVIAHMKLMDVPTPESIAAGFSEGDYYNLFCYKAAEGKLKVYHVRDVETHKRTERAL